MYPGFSKGGLPLPELLQKIVEPFKRIWARLRGAVGLNIGTVMFAVLFLYMAFSAFLYMTSSHIESYQVISGPLSKNETYTGLVLREEQTVKAESNGYLTYFAREGSKINANGPVYGVSTTKIPETDAKLSSRDLAQIRKEMLSFSKSFSSSKFNSTYSFKSVLQGDILQYAGVNGNVVSTVSDGTDGDTESSSVISSVTLGNQTISRAKSDGIVLYSEDGYENLSVETLTKSDFNQNTYHETDLKTKDTVKVGDDIYTIITDERWSLLIPLSKRQAVKLSNRTTIRVKFLKDGMTQTGEFSVVEIDGDKYGKIDFSRGLIRYATDRFLDIELVTNTVTGLKIPLTSIVTKEFYTIPSEFATKNEDSNEVGFMVTSHDDNGKTVNTFVTATIYAGIPIDKSGNGSLATGEDGDEVPKLYYVNKKDFHNGDAIIDQKSGKKFIVSDIGVLEGVYSINQGYAVFRRIELLDQNEEYVIVSSKTPYGLSRYDHIVRNADQVKEEDILY